MSSGTTAKAARKGQAFALYYLPKAEAPVFISGATEKHDVLPEETRSAFVFAPYKSAIHTPIYLISADIFAKGECAKALAAKNSIVLSKSLKPSHASHGQQHYEKMVQTAIEKIKREKDLQKVVLGRTLEVSLKKGFSPLSFLEKMHDASPEVLCYLVYIPEQGLWMGATPECLLEECEGKVQTHAVAGTLPQKDDVEWSQKELEEQQFVSDFIAQRLEEGGIENYHVTERQTVHSGAVRHLKTTFSFDINEADSPSLLIQLLHPTPAVCGMPPKAADDFIAEYETCHRLYYTGYLGPVNVAGETAVFVNLRCMKVGEKEAQLFVGAGITVDSLPGKEWEETIIKAETLLHLIKSI